MDISYYAIKFNVLLTLNEITNIYVNNSDNQTKCLLCENISEVREIIKNE